VAAEKLVTTSRTAADVLAAESRAVAARAARVSRSVTGAVVERALAARTGPTPPPDDIERISLEPIPAGFTQAPPRVTPVAAVPAIPAPASEASSEADPERVVEMEITGEFSFPMELTVGATFMIAEGGRVSADISTVHAIVLGQYSGTLRASRSIRVGPRAHVEGVLEAPEVEIADGAVVNGLPATPEELEVPADEAPDDQVPPESSSEDESGAPTDDEIFVASPIFTDGVSRG
jgi:cytoskeletal protein CcmA (bactofilin family)